MSYRQPVRAQIFGAILPSFTLAAQAGGMSMVRTLPLLGEPNGFITQVPSRGRTEVSG